MRRRLIASLVLLCALAAPAAWAQAPAPGSGSTGSSGSEGTSTGASGTGGASTAVAPEPTTPTGTTPTLAPSRHAVAQASVNLRTAPGGGHVVGRLRRAASVSISCHEIGQTYSSPTGASQVWDRVSRRPGHRSWTADGYLNTGTDVLVAPLCGEPALTPYTPGASAGTCGIVAPVTVLPPFTDVGSFIAAAVPGAQDSQSQFAVPASVTLAQGILETGGGRFTAGGNNFFGIKAVESGPFSWAFGTNAVGCVLKKTLEVYGGRYVRTVSAFRAYDSLSASILDHGQLLATNPVYAPAFQHTDDPATFAKDIAVHYATDPAYASKLIQLMDRYDLHQYDL